MKFFFLYNEIKEISHSSENSYKSDDQSGTGDRAKLPEKQTGETGSSSMIWPSINEYMSSWDHLRAISVEDVDKALHGVHLISSP